MFWRVVCPGPGLVQDWDGSGSGPGLGRIQGWDGSRTGPGPGLGPSHPAPHIWTLGDRTLLE